MEAEEEPPRDEDLARAIGANQDREVVEHNARLVATYWTTLVNSGVSEDAATDLTHQWIQETQGDE